MAAVTELAEATDDAHAQGLDVVAELQAAGLGGTALPPLEQAAGPGDAAATALGHVPEGQLPPV